MVLNLKYFVKIIKKELLQTLVTPHLDATLVTMIAFLFLKVEKGTIFSSISVDDKSLILNHKKQTIKNLTNFIK